MTTIAQAIEKLGNCELPMENILAMMNATPYESSEHPGRVTNVYHFRDDSKLIVYTNENESQPRFVSY